MSDLESRIAELESEVKRLQKQIELLLTLRCAARSEVMALHQLLGEVADRLGCPPERFLSVYVQNQRRYHQQLLAAVEDKHPALASRMDDRPPEAVPGVDDPDPLFP